MRQLNEKQVQQKWRFPHPWEIDDEGVWIHNENWQKHRLRVLKIRNIEKNV